MHDDPERRALAQPRHDVADHVRGAGTSRLAHHAGAHDESHVWLEEVRSDERNKHEHREASPQGRATQPACRHDAPADTPVTRIESAHPSTTPNRMCALSLVKLVELEKAGIPLETNLKRYRRWQVYTKGRALDFNRVETRCFAS